TATMPRRSSVNVKLEALMSLVFRTDCSTEFMVLVGSEEPLREHVSSCKNLGRLNRFSDRPWREGFWCSTETGCRCAHLILDGKPVLVVALPVGFQSAIGYMESSCVKKVLMNADCRRLEP